MPGPWCKPIGSNTKDFNPFVLCYSLMHKHQADVGTYHTHPLPNPFSPSAMVQDQLATQGRLWPRRIRSSVPERWNHQNWRDGACFVTAGASGASGAGVAIPQREETGFLSLLSSQVVSLCNLPSEIHQLDRYLAIPLYLQKPTMRCMSE